jgi:hypothetical protein
MITTRTLLFAGWIFVAVVLWVAAVPARISASTFCWLNLAALALGTTFVTAVRSAGPTRSIAHILYDTEQQASSRR